MNLFLLHKLHGLTSGVGFEQLVVSHGQIDFQSVYNVWLVVTNQNVVHVLHLSASSLYPREV